MNEIAQFEEMPAPGEPLKPKIHPDNQKILAEEAARRAELMSARLGYWERVKLVRRHRLLKRKVTSYNKLIQQRWRVYYEYRQAARQYQQSPSRSLRDRGRALAAKGRELNNTIKALEPLAQEYQSITNRLKAHDELIRYEREERQNRAAFRLEARVWESQIKAVFRQSPRLHHTYSDSKGRTKTVIPQISRAIHREDRVLFHIKTTSQTPIERMLGKWHSALPYGVDVRDLTCDETLENMSAVCKRLVTVERSKNGVNLFYCISRLDSSDGIPHKVPFSKVMQWYPTTDRHLMPFAAGVTTGKRVKWFNFEQYPHVLVAGSTKSGKSNFVNQMIATLVTMHDTSELRLMLIDLKGGIEFVHWREIAQLTGQIAKTPEMVLETLRDATTLMRSRFELFEAAKAKNLISYNHMSSEPLPRVVIVFDEMATLLNLGRLTQDIHAELRELASQGRAVGIHLVLCTQHPSVDVLPGWIKTNLGLRISGKMMTLGGSMTILDTGSAATLPDVRGRLIFSDGHSEIIAQAPLITDAEIARAVEISKQYVRNAAKNAIINSEINQPRYSLVEQMIIHSIKEFGGHLRRDDLCKQFSVSKRRIEPLMEKAREMLSQGFEYDGIEYRLKRAGKASIATPIATKNEASDRRLDVAIESKEVTN